MCGIVVVFSIFVAGYCEVNAIPIIPMVGGTIFGLTLPLCAQSVVELSDNEYWKASQRKLERAGILKKDTIIRISFAYLFRIKVDGKYFLVLNNRTKKYQPVGGAYKFYQEEADYLRDHIPVENDDRIPVDKITERDYRLLVKNKHLRKFVKRFNKTIYRENILDLSREFTEELFASNILDKDAFGALSYKFCGRHMTTIEKSPVFKCYELLLADIVEVQLSELQKELFRNLMKEESDQYCFAKSEEIESFGVKYGTNELEDRIADHTIKILSGNSEQLTMRNKYTENFVVYV